MSSGRRSAARRDEPADAVGLLAGAVGSRPVGRGTRSAARSPGRPRPRRARRRVHVAAAAGRRPGPAARRRARAQAGVRSGQGRCATAPAPQAGSEPRQERTRRRRPCPGEGGVAAWCRDGSNVHHRAGERAGMPSRFCTFGTTSLPRLVDGCGPRRGRSRRRDRWTSSARVTPWTSGRFCAGDRRRPLRRRRSGSGCRPGRPCCTPVRRRAGSANLPCGALPIRGPVPGAGCGGWGHAPSPDATSDGGVRLIGP
jgi:hypothetical protein